MMVASGLESFESCFEKVDDPRIVNRCDHSLHSILFIAVAATIAGADGPEDMEVFAHRKSSWLKRYIDLAGGIPSHDTIGRVLGLIKPKQFQEAFLAWISSLPTLHDSDGKTIFVPIDGKTMRGSYSDDNKSDMLHIVSAWATEQGMTLGQVAVDSKSNEITAIPDLLEMLELSGTIISIDAMGCQRAIASKIISGGGDYVLMVKKNQPKLLEAVECAFEESNLKAAKSRTRTTTEKSRGRLERREYTIMKAPTSMKPLMSKWTGLQSIGRVIRTVERDGKVTRETSYYICSIAAVVSVFMTSIRSHWGIENSLHWVMDVVFHEDRSRVRKNHAAENLSFLRRFVISLLRRDTSKTSLKQKRKEAAWDTTFLENLLFS